MCEEAPRLLTPPVQQRGAALPLDHVLVDELGHDGDGHGGGGGGQDVLDLGVLKGWQTWTSARCPGGAGKTGRARGAGLSP